MTERSDTPRPFNPWSRDLMAGAVALGLLAVLAVGLGYWVGTETRPESGAAASLSGAPVPAESRSLAASAGATAGEGEGAQQTSLPRWTGLYVNDYADLLPPAAEAQLRAQVRDVWREDGVELTVLTIPTMRDYGHDGPIEPFATALFNDWGIGDADRNDGVLVLIARNDRTMRIELGAGYAPRWDGVMAGVIQGTFLPAFRQDDYENGIMDGVAETIRQVTGHYPGEASAAEDPTVLRGWKQIGREARDAPFHLLVLMAAISILGAVALRLHIRNRPRACLECGRRMSRMAEEADDAHLDGGQRLEEYLQSVDYDVWACPDEGCGHLRIERWRNWFSRRSTCPACGYRTMETESTTLRPATTSSTGLRRLDYFCPHCRHRDSETRIIPRKSKSSGGGSGGFGGGSSSGGGASGSW